MRIVFLGTPDFAVPSLQAIVEAGFDVVAVVTAPDKPAGRGLQPRLSPVKIAAMDLHIPVLQPSNLKDPSFLANLKNYQADLQVVIAFRMLPEAVWNMPPLGTINLHASLLPDYRGAAPINRAIMNGETKTGVCTFFLQHEIDTGNLIDSDSCEIAPDMNAGALHDILMQKGAALIVKTIKNIKDKNYHTTPQHQIDTNKTAPKIFTADCKIDWNNKGEKIYNQIRGLSPFPGAFTSFNNKTMKIYSAAFLPANMENSKPGDTNLTDHKSIQFACLNGWINALEIQMEGKKRMQASEFLKGYRP